MSEQAFAASQDGTRFRYVLWLLCFLPMIGTPQLARALPITQADPADMIFITIAGTTLTQELGGKNPNDIVFDQTKFPNYKGYDFSGEVIGFPSAGIVRLQGADNQTGFVVTRPVGQNLMPLNIVFGADFNQPKTKTVVAQDAISGNFNNKLGMHILGKGNKLSFQGFVNGNAIMPPNGPYVSEPAGGTRFPVPFGGAHGPLDVGGGPVWMLKAEVLITLATDGDRIAQAPIPPSPPMIASVSILPPAPAKVPEPASWISLAFGSFALTLVGRGKRSPRRNRDHRVPPA